MARVYNKPAPAAAADAAGARDAIEEREKRALLQQLLFGQNECAAAELIELLDVINSPATQHRLVDVAAFKMPCWARPHAVGPRFMGVIGPFSAVFFGQGGAVRTLQLSARAFGGGRFSVVEAVLEGGAFCIVDAAVIDDANVAKKPYGQRLAALDRSIRARDIAVTRGGAQLIVLKALPVANPDAWPEQLAKLGGCGAVALRHNAGRDEHVWFRERLITVNARLVGVGACLVALADLADWGELTAPPGLPLRVDAPTPCTLNLDTLALTPAAPRTPPATVAQMLMMLMPPGIVFRALPPPVAASPGRRYDGPRSRGPPPTSAPKRFRRNPTPEPPPAVPFRVNEEPPAAPISRPYSPSAPRPSSPSYAPYSPTSAPDAVAPHSPSYMPSSPPNYTPW